MLRRYKRCPIGKLKGKPGWCVIGHISKKVLSCYTSKKKGQEAIKRMAKYRKK